MIKKRFNPITDKSSEIIAFLMASPDIPDDPDLRFKIELSVEEAVENVVHYAYEGGIGWLEAGTSLDHESLVLTIELRDAGVPFNPLESRPRREPFRRPARSGWSRHLPLQKDDG
jgi:anti-sigma regulatory factor (Ser/Thr protein kinase)